MSELLRYLPFVRRTRRNHAVEHAAISIITERHPSTLLRGRSNGKGFYVFGDVDTAELESAINEALRRLRAGEVELAIHPRCGTNLAVAGILSGLSAALAAQMKPRQNRFTYAVLAALAALMVSPSLGTEAQRHLTTEADLGDLRVEGIERRRMWGDVAHWIQTRST